jgi:hypothetical protein
VCEARLWVGLLTQAAGTRTSCRKQFFLLPDVYIDDVGRYACLPSMFPFVSPTFCFGSKADSQTLWWNIVRARNCPFSFFFVLWGQGIVLWVVMSVRFEYFPIASTTFCLGSKADRHTSWCNIVMMKESPQLPLFLLFCFSGGGA